jgi:nucleotide-binding universal stress UspA family protein
MKIIIAYDGSPSAEAAVEEALRRPWPQGSEIRLVTVVEPRLIEAPMAGLEVYGPLYERVRATVREESYRGIKKVMKRFEARADLKVGYDLREGEVRACLLDAIREWKADLVIAGSHGVKGLARFLLGSVCHALVTHAPCNVEIVKLQAAA